MSYLSEVYFMINKMSQLSHLLLKRETSIQQVYGCIFMVNKGNRLYKFIFPFLTISFLRLAACQYSAMFVLPGNDQEEKCRSFIELTPGETQGWLQ